MTIDPKTLELHSSTDAVVKDIIAMTTNRRLRVLSVPRIARLAGVRCQTVMEVVSQVTKIR